MNEKRFKVAVYDDKAINGFTVLDLQKPNSLKRLKYENVYIGSKAGCEIVCNFGNSLADENEQLKEEIKDLNDILARYEERVLKERTNHNEKDCGHCKHLQIDGMFGMWCEKKHNWTEVKYCKDYER